MTPHIMSMDYPAYLQGESCLRSLHVSSPSDASLVEGHCMAIMPPWYVKA